MYMSILCMYDYVLCACNAEEDQKKASDPQELKLQMISLHVGVKNCTLVL